MKRLVVSTVGAGVLLLSVAACAGSQESVGFGGQPATSSATSSPSAPASSSPTSNNRGPFAKPPAGGTALPENRVTVANLPAGQPTLVWTAGDGRTVGFYGREGGCTKVHGEVAEQGPNGVKIIMVEQQPAKPKICTMDLRYPPVTVQLTDPLGDRPLTLDHRIDKVDN